MNPTQEFLQASKTILAIVHWCDQCQRETRHVFVRDQGKYEIYICAAPRCGHEYWAAVR